MTMPVGSGGGGARWPLFLLLALLVWQAPLFWRQVEIERVRRGPAYENSELYQVVFPRSHYAFDRMRRGDTPLWCPEQLCGYPIHADPQTGLFQPLNAVFMWMPTQRALAVHAGVCLILSGLGTALFLRRLGVGWLAVFLGMQAWVFSGGMAAGMSRPSVGATLAWAPLCFWAVAGVLRSGKSSSAVLAGLAGALLLLAGAPAAALPALLLLAGWIVWDLLTPRPEGSPGRVRVVGLLLVALFFALSVSAVQWLPSLFWLLTLDAPLDALWRFPVDALAPNSILGVLDHLLQTRTASLPRLVYAGVLALLLLPAALFRKGLRREAFFFLGIAAGLAILAGAGGSTLTFGFPARAALVFLPFALAMTAAIGADRLLALNPEGRPATAWVPGLLALGLGAALFYASAAQTRGYLLVFAFLLLPVLLFRVRWVVVCTAVVMALLQYVDLTVASANRYPHPLSDAPECYRAYERAVTEAASQAGTHRMMLSARDLDHGLPANLGMLYPLDVAGGAGLPLSRDTAVWWNALSSETTSATDASRLGVTPAAGSPPLANLMSVRLVLATPEGPLFDGRWEGPGPRLHLADTVDRLRLFVNEDALPRVYWVPRWEPGYGAAAAVANLLDPSLDLNRTCLLDTAPGMSAAREDTVPEFSRLDATCAITLYEPERVFIQVTAPADGITVLTDTHDPGWRVTLDGQPVPLLRANGLFRGVATPAGTHTIEMIYAPSPLRAGALVSMAGLALAALAGSIRLARSGRRDRQSKA
jgi:hypothetical protein